MSGNMVVFVAVMAFLASWAVEGSPVEVAAPSKCCLPRKYSMAMTALDTINSKAITMYAVQMDADRKQMAMLNYSMPVPPAVPGAGLTNKIIFDFNRATVYIVSPGSPERCVKGPYTQKLMLCIPDDAQYLGATYLGPVTSPLVYDGWRFNVPIIHKVASGSDAVVTLTVSKKNCVPIVEGVYIPGAPKEFQNQAYIYTNFVPTLTDPTAFDLPPSCFE